MSIELIDTIRPKNSGVFPIAIASELLGGSYAVADSAARDAIPIERRIAGLKVTTLDTHVTYILTEGGVGGSNDYWLADVRQTAFDIRDFGAKGDGTTNDTSAFQAAATAINAAGGGTLLLQPVTYIVGRQDFAGATGHGYSYRGQDVLRFLNCTRGVRIAGNGAKIKIASGLKYGSFDPVTGLSYTPVMPFIDTDYAAGVVSEGIIRAQQCAYLVVEDLELDGNSGAAVLGGSWGDTGRQLTGSAFLLSDNAVVAFSNVNAHHHCLDGVLFTGAGDLDTDGKRRIVFINCLFEYNGRQGVSLCDGSSGFYALNCKFNHTGKGAINSSPSAGVDIEPTAGSSHEVRFTNCEFLNNSGVGAVCDYGFSGNDRRDILFTACTFWGTDTYAIWPNAPNITFVDCSIYGPVLAYGYKENLLEANKFIRCHFEDKPHPTYGVASSGYLIDGGSSSANVLFEDCTIIVNTTRIMWLQATGATEISDYATIRGCRICNKWTALPDGASDEAVFYGVRIEDSVFWDSVTTPPATGWGFATGGAIIGSGVYCLGPYTTFAGAKGLIGQGKSHWTETETPATVAMPRFFGLQLSDFHSRGAIHHTTVLACDRAPTAGTWAVGDICWNNLPSSDGIIGWRCIADGTPGTWIEILNPLDSPKVQLWNGTPSSITLASTRQEITHIPYGGSPVSVAFTLPPSPSNGEVVCFVNWDGTTAILANSGQQIANSSYCIASSMESADKYAFVSMKFMIDTWVVQSTTGAWAYVPA